MTKISDSVLNIKSYAFAIRIVKLSQYLYKEKSEFIISKQVLRSGTAIGAMVRESEFSQSTSDFIHKLSIALKEANETDYWISLLFDTEYIDKKLSNSLQIDCKELIALLVSSIKTLKSKK
ncbi:four helix bundle protein [Dysgonomonas sp. 511]|uniref:four helix bundle protein n=1 Tax=Dysgonomonas sp. 511 TaxID=2302930 RepID=UPI0013D363EF|nr:four helix bundle protein [Dysgonomonas sp. 511]NDV78030.1 four helix bundle protein [Dysgonomonas sp. 511]